MSSSLSTDKFKQSSKEEEKESTIDASSTSSHGEKKVIDKEFHDFMAELKKVTSEDNKFTQEYQL